MDLNDLVQELRQHQRLLSSVVKRLKELSKAPEKRGLRDLAAVARRITEVEKSLEQLAQTRDFARKATAILQQRRKEVASATEQSKRRFGAELDRAVRPLGISLSGQGPELGAGLFTVELNFDSTRARIWYGPKQERLAECVLSCDAIVKSLRQAKQSLGCKLDKSQFLDKLYCAYQRTTAAKAGQPAPIVAVLGELAPLLQTARFRADPRVEHYKTYSRADFSYDLFRASKPHASTLFPQRVHLTVATRAHTRKRQDFLWVPKDQKSGSGTTYSHISFSENT